MTELAAKPPPPEAEDLALNLQIPMIIPKEIRDFRLAGQLPPGNIAYIDLREAEVIRFVDQRTWKPVTVWKNETRINLEEKKKKRFAAIILHTPPRTPDDAYDEQIKEFADNLSIKSKENGVAIRQKLGTLFIVEDRGADERIGWREAQMTKHGLVVDKEKGERSVIVTSDYIISQGRRQKKRVPVNLKNGEHSRHMIKPFLKAIRDNAAAQGLDADTTELEKNIMASSNPPGTISDLEIGGNVAFQGTNTEGVSIYHETNRSGEEQSSSGDDFRLSLRPDVKKTSPKPGDVAVREDLTCSCGNHPTVKYYSEPGRKRMILYEDTICNNAHPDGYPKIFDRHQYVQALGLLPPIMKNQNTRRK